MPLEATLLATAMKAKAQAKNAAFAANVGDSMDWLFAALAEATIEHIKANAVVSVSCVVTGITTGASISGPGSGTGTLS